jgi:hypothetical protein
MKGPLLLKQIKNKNTQDESKPGGVLCGGTFIMEDGGRNLSAISVQEAESPFPQRPPLKTHDLHLEVKV